VTWLLLALGSAISLSLTDLFAKRALGSLPVTTVAWVRFAFPLPILVAAMAAGGWVWPRGGFWAAMLCALPLEILASLLYQKALQLSPLGLTAPYLAFTPAFLAFTGRWILGEVPSSHACVGIALVTLGGYWIQLTPGTGPMEPLRALVRERGSVLMLVVAFLYSFTAALGKVAVVQSNPQTFAAVYYTVLTVLMGPWAAHSLRRRTPRPGLAKVLPVGIFGASMILCHYTAIRLAPASYMIAVKRTSLLWSILLGRFALGEGNLTRRLAGGALMLAGVGVLAVLP
jgi:drug/metabolite transporter (DMT)-like permease